MLSTGCTIYKPWYQPYELHEVHQSTSVKTRLIPGGVDFVYTGIPNPIWQVELNGRVSYRIATKLPRPWL